MGNISIYENQNMGVFLLTEKFDWKNILNEYRAGGKSRNGTQQTFDRRNEFENDFDRITFSSSLRRLQDKAQVFPLEKKDFVRSRLTHSLEVSTLARSLGLSVGRYLEENKIDSFSTEDTNKVSAILACAGLMHDIGNPPFGHFGETAIRDWFENYFGYRKARNFTEIRNKEHFIEVKNVGNRSSLSEQQINDFINFEGNAQALRLLTRLHFFIDDKGMNLTYGVLNSIIKYPRKSTEVNKEKDISFKKMGYFTAEMDVFNNIVGKTGLRDKRNPLVFLLEAADDIAYRVADIEDGLKKGVIGFDNIYYAVMNIVNEDTLSEYKRIGIYPEDSDKMQSIENLIKEDGNLFYLFKLDTYYSEAKKYNYEDPSTYAVQRFRVTVQGNMMNAVTEAFIRRYDDIMEGELKEELLKISHASKISNALKNIAYDYIFKDKKVIKLEVVGHRVIWGLLDIFVPAVLSANYQDSSTKEGKLYQLISLNYRFVNEQFNKSEWGKDENFLYNRLLLVTDFICSMTDSYALELYQELTGIRL
jgi:dGTPase